MMADERPWHEDDEFWEAFAPFMFRAELWDQARESADDLARLLELAPGARVLDLCCGPGRYALELARRGMKVTGVDRTGLYVEEARKRAGADGLDIEFVQADMREFVRPGAFDACISMFTSIGYFADQAEDRRAVENVFASLKPGGRFVVNTMVRETLFHIFAPRTWDRAEDGTLMLQEREMNDDWSRIENRWTLIRDGVEREYRLGHRLYSAAEMRELLEGAGFTGVRSFGDLAGGPFNRDARGLSMVACKPEA
jgi:SAM-dependent methyltransferase